MDPVLVVILVGIPVAWLLVMAGYAYVDAPKYGMDPRKWALISFFVPLFGFFWYVFEREDRTRDPVDLAVDEPYMIHESRREDAGPERPNDGGGEGQWEDEDGDRDGDRNPR